MRITYLPEWEEFFKQEYQKPYWKKLIDFVNQEYHTKTIFPKLQDIFKIFNLVKPQDVKVVIIGQDPYHGFNQAMGIAFSVSNLVSTPPSLKNMFKELKDDLNIDHFENNDLSNWVKQGVFLINTVFTVEKSKPNSHQNKGWETFVKNCLEYLNKINNHQIIYCLFGNHAKNTYNNLEILKNNFVIETGHPSPFSYEKYFKGSKPFSKINKLLIDLNQEPIQWVL